MANIKQDKQTAIRISDELMNVAYSNIKVRSAIKIGKSESFSEYVRNLIIEDFHRIKKRMSNIKKSESNE
jgi:hypothetical protein